MADDRMTINELRRRSSILVKMLGEDFDFECPWCGALKEKEKYHQSFNTVYSCGKCERRYILLRPKPVAVILINNTGRYTFRDKYKYTMMDDE